MPVKKLITLTEENFQKMQEIQRLRGITTTSGCVTALINDAYNSDHDKTADDTQLREIAANVDYNVPLVKTQMKKIIVTAKTLYSHPKNVSKIYAALHTDLAW